MPRLIDKSTVMQLLFVAAAVMLLLTYTHWSDVQLLIDGHMGHP